MMLVTIPATPHLGFDRGRVRKNRRTSAGFFMPSKRPYQKPALPIQEQLKLLKDRGLQIKDEARAARYLTYISYYRFAGYCLPFQIRTGADKHKFKEGVDFDQILSVYIFDRELRLLVMDAVERIEVAVRTVLISRMAVNHANPHWYLDAKHFQNRYDHAALIETIKETIGINELPNTKNSKKTVFVKHYLDNYDPPALPAVWMICEVMSLGAWSMIYSNLADFHDRKRISLAFDIGAPEVFESFLHCIAILRNICAHHSLLWNRVFQITPRQILIGGFELKQNTSFYAQAAVVKKLLFPVSPDSDWTTRLYLLFHKYQNIQPQALGFPLNWHKNQFWGVNQEIVKSVQPQAIVASEVANAKPA